MIQKISAVIITLNEERNIARCLQSLHDIVDEIVVLDSGSTDRTEEICKSFGVRFFQHAFEGHIQQKNRALRQTTFSCVISLDADEALSEELKKSILQVKQNWQADGYVFNRLNNYCGSWIRHCGWYPDVKLRLWDKRKGCWGGENPHDKVIMEKNAKLKHIKGDLLHYSFYTINEHIAQINKFSSIAAEERYRKGKKSPSVISIILRAKWKFVKGYIFNLGFLDGYPGYLVCKYSAMATFTKYVKLRELHSAQKNENLSF